MDNFVSSNSDCRFGVLTGKRRVSDSMFELPTQTTKQRAGGTASGLFAKETSETRKLNNRLRKRKASRLQAREAGKDDSKDIDLKRDVT